MSQPIYGIAVGVGVGAAAVVPWLTPSFAVSIATYALVVAMAALSAHVLAVAGQPVLDRAAYVGAGAYAAALASTWWGGWLAVQLGAAVLTGAALSAMLGLLVSKTRAMVSLLVTFCLSELAVAATTHWSTIGGGNGLSTNGFVLWPGTSRVTGTGWVYLCVLALTGVCAAATGSLMTSRIGLTLRAIRANEARSAATGLRVTARLWTAYVLAGVIAGAAGAALIMARRYVSPSDLGFEMAAAALAAALVGKRSVALTMLIAAGLIAVRDLLGAQFAGYGPLLLGVALIAAAITSNQARAEAA